MGKKKQVVKTTRDTWEKWEKVYYIKLYGFTANRLYYQSKNNAQYVIKLFK